MAEVNTYNDFSVAAREDNPLISNMSFLLKPQVGANLFDVNPMETDLGDMMRMGLMKETKGEDTIHHEARKRFDAPFVNTSTTSTDVFGLASVGNGDPVLFDTLDYIQLAVKSHSPSTGSLAGQHSHPRAGQLIMFKNKAVWRIQGKRTTVNNAHRLYITKVKASFASLTNTITLAGGINGGDQFAVITTAFEEATFGMLKGKVPTTKSVTSFLQSFGDFYSITDFAERNETYPLAWQGKTIQFVYVKGLDDTEKSFTFYEEFGLFLSPKDDGALTALQADGSTPAVTTTQGYIPTLDDNAQKLFYDTNPTIALFENIIRLRRKLHQGRKAMIQYGYEFGLRAKDIFTNFGKEGGIVYNLKAIDLNISMIYIGGFEFYCKELQILNHPEVTAIDGFEYPHNFIVAPMDKTRDPKTGIMENAFCIIYKRMVGKGARGHYKIWATGGNSEAGTDSQLIRKINLASRKGMKVVGADKFIYGKRSES